MEYRKLISFGKSSYVVSLPKSWVKLSKLKKGDLVYIEENEGNLLLQPRANEEGDKEKEIIINVDGKDLRRIQRETISAYLQNNKTIILAGNEIKEKAKEIQNFIQNLIALEIIEQDSKRIVAKDFLNINDISIEQIIRKMDVIVRSMLKDCKEMFKEDSYENLYLRDNDVNKFRFLIYRIIWFGIENPSQIFKKLNIKQKDLFINWWLAFSIESIADYVKRIARDMKKIKLSKKEQEEYLNILNKIDLTYHNMMKSYYTNNIEEAHNILHERFEMIMICDNFYQKNINIANVGNLIYNTKSLIVTIHTIGRIVYQGMPG